MAVRAIGVRSSRMKADLNQSYQHSYKNYSINRARSTHALCADKNKDDVIARINRKSKDFSETTNASAEWLKQTQNELKMHRCSSESDLIYNQPHECPKDGVDSFSYTRREIKTFNHLWIIDNFKTYLEDPDPVICLHSSTFSPLTEINTDWRILCYPKGTYGNLSPSLILQLEYVRGERDIKARAQFFILDGDDDPDEIEVCKDQNYCIYKPGILNNARSYSNGSLKYEVILGALDKKDRLKVLVKVSMMENSVTEPTCYPIQRNIPFNEKEAGLAKDLLKLLESDDRSDLTIIVYIDGLPKSQFKAHKLLLAARSPVFAAMLSGETRENNRGEIEIHDMKPETVKALLEFIYGGQLDDECEPIELYRAADKYAVEELRERVEMKLVSSICAENAAEILLLADMHRSSILKRRALDFIAAHPAQVTQSDGWKRYVACVPDLVTEVVRATAMF